MGRRKKHKKKASATVAPPRLAIQESSAKKSRRRLYVAGAIAVPIVALLALIIFAPKSISDFAFGDQVEDIRKPFPRFSAAGQTAQQVRFEDFVGSEACAECHAKEYEVWKQSTHGRAGGTPGQREVLGKFDRSVLRFKDATVLPRREKNGKYVFEVLQRGFDTKTFEVDAVVGGGFLEGGGTQTYFAEFPDGTLRFLPFDFIKQENLWFGETSEGRGWKPINQELAITDLGEWPPTRILGTHSSFQNCQQCHGSQILVDYDPKERKYATRYTSLTINCESCHGPGKRHIELARRGDFADSEEIGMRALATFGKDESLKVCFQCHSLKDALETNYLPGMKLEEYYSLKFPIFGETPYYPDGRIRAFGYQQNHLFSDCYLNGSMTCVDCHDPHSQSYRDINGQALTGKFDNGQCTACHASKAQNPEQHSKHPPDSRGNLCISCHMPFLQHGAVGDQLRFARSDHTIPIPRPAFDNELGIENACQKCHAEKTITWLQAKTEEWYGQLKPHKKIIANQVGVAGINDRVRGSQLLLEDAAPYTIAQFSGLSVFIEKFLSPDMVVLEPQIVDRLMKLSQSEDVDVRALALASLHLSRDRDARVHEFLVDQLETLGPAETAVRKRWAVALAFIGRIYRDEDFFDKAIRTYKKSVEIMPDNAATLTNLGVTYARKGELNRAIDYFNQAIALDRNEVMAYVSKGIALQRFGDVNAERAAYERAIEVNPWNTLAHFNLGNWYYKADRYLEAIAEYERAIELEPNLALAHFYLGRALAKTREPEKAAAALRSGLQFEPENKTARQMLTDLEVFLRGSR